MPETTPDPWEYSLYIPQDPRAVTVCRRTLRLILTLHGLVHLADTAELLASELMSNVVLHTKGPGCLRIRFRDGVLQIGAWDADPEPPSRQAGWRNSATTPRAGGAWLSSGTVPTSGTGSRCPAWGIEASWCGAS